jgi:hypothetical protein
MEAFSPICDTLESKQGRKEKKVVNEKVFSASLPAQQKSLLHEKQ